MLLIYTIIINHKIKVSTLAYFIYLGHLDNKINHNELSLSEETSLTLTSPLSIHNSVYILNLILYNL